MMKKPVLVALCLMAPMFGGAPAASAQIMIPPGSSSLSPPPPPPPPPPSMAVPVVPKFDAPPGQPRVGGSARRRSFGDRVTDCLHEGAAAGLDPGERAAYSRACAQR